jgi:hypothetical protein
MAQYLVKAQGYLYICLQYRFYTLVAAARYAVDPGSFARGAVSRIWQQQEAFNTSDTYPALVSHCPLSAPHRPMNGNVVCMGPKHSVCISFCPGNVGCRVNCQYTDWAAG